MIKGKEKIMKFKKENKKLKIKRNYHKVKQNLFVTRNFMKKLKNRKKIFRKI